MQDQFYLYILKCANGAYYIGHTDNIEQRLSEHQSGTISNCYTKTRRPLELMFVQNFPTRDDALHAERQLKGWSRKKKEAFIRGDWQAIKELNILQKTKKCSILRQASAYVKTSADTQDTFTGVPVKFDGAGSNERGGSQ